MSGPAGGTGVKHRDIPSIVLAALFAGLGAWVLSETAAMSALGSVFPRAIAIAMIVLSLALVVQQLRRPPRPAAALAAAVVQLLRTERLAPETDAETPAPRRVARPAAERPPASQGSTARRLALAAVMAAWALLMPVVGFFVTGVLAFLVLLAVANYDRWTWRRLAVQSAVGVAVVTGFYLLFVKVLLVPVPAGWLF